MRPTLGAGGGVNAGTGSRPGATRRFASRIAGVVAGGRVGGFAGAASCVGEAGSGRAASARRSSTFRAAWNSSPRPIPGCVIRFISAPVARSWAESGAFASPRR